VRTSQETDKISAALAKMAGQLTNPRRNLTATVKGRSKGGRDYEYQYMYASLDSILDMIRPVLNECELFVTQGILGDMPPYRLVTRITHSSGQWHETDIPLPYSGSVDPQELGIAHAYARRYGLAPMLGIAPEEDKDGARTEKDKRKGSPSEGVEEHLDEPTRNRMTDVATVIQDWADQGKMDVALKEWEGTDFKGNQEAKIFAWTLLSAPTRSALKRLQADRAKGVRL
jgi:hypothetical protein